ncbi:MAG: RND transporter [Gammaproteobacteria bacterium]|nr:RND transporter [Gammaproteobacteria bacterium]
MLKIIDSLPLPHFIVLSLFLGLAPFFPEPHLAEKVRMLMSGELVKPLDMFDLLLHGTPWVLLLIKLTLVFKKNKQTAA